LKTRTFMVARPQEGR